MGTTREMHPHIREVVKKKKSFKIVQRKIIGIERINVNYFTYIKKVGAYIKYIIASTTIKDTKIYG